MYRLGKENTFLSISYGVYYKQMIPREDVMKILECGIQAPSGENSQPWKFVVKSDDEIELWNVPERDLSLYNYGQYGSYVAHGALIENIAIAAAKFGYRARAELFPERGSEKFVARVRFAKENAKEDKLYGAIFTRATNRKAYAPEPLTEEQKSEFSASPREVGFGVLRLVERHDAKESIAHAVSANDEMVLANRHIHHFFFSHVRWTQKESDANPSGFYVPTLELAPPQLMGFKLFRHWPVARTLNAILKISKLVATENAKVFVKSAAMGAVLIPDASSESFVKGGKLVERIWLKAAHMGLSFQPLVGGSFLVYALRAGETKYFTQAQVHRLLSADETLRHAFGVTAGEIAMIFRVGKGGEPSARSPRFPVSYFIENPLFAPSSRGQDSVPSDRKTIIEHILHDLRTLHGNPAFENQYAVEENLAFFEAIKSIPKYLWWLIARAPKIDGTRLLELTDLPFPRWDREMHRKLIELESRDFPGLVAPLVRRIIDLASEEIDSPFIAVNLGCGGMEVERQVVKKLLEQNSSRRVVLIGVDTSPIAHEIAKENLREIEPSIAIYEIGMIDAKKLQEIFATEKRRHVVILSKNDIFELHNQFTQGTFDVVYHSLFKHHLNQEQKRSVEFVIRSLGRHGLEYDGYKSWPHLLLPHTLTAWKHPAFLNGSIFSDLRYSTKKEISAMHPKAKPSFYRIGTYLLEK